MHNNKIYILVIGLCTIMLFLRTTPFIFFKGIKFSKRMTLFLKCIPFASISALVFPDILRIIPNHRLASYIGTISVLIFAYFFKNYLYTVICSITIVYLVIKFI